MYGSMPSDTIFSEIAAEENEFCFDVDVAKEKYKRFSTLPPDKQSAEWYKLLHASREAKCGNVIEGQRRKPSPVLKPSFPSSMSCTISLEGSAELSMWGNKYL